LGAVGAVDGGMQALNRVNPVIGKRSQSAMFMKEKIDFCVLMIDFPSDPLKRTFEIKNYCDFNYDLPNQRTGAATSSQPNGSTNKPCMTTLTL